MQPITLKARLASVVSDWKDMRRGYPQGSSFGSLLWNIFQNDLTYQITDANLSMYADDHQIYVIAESISELEQTLKNKGVVNYQDGTMRTILRAIIKSMLQ